MVAEPYRTCCILGHRTITESKELKNRICDVLEHLIENEKVDTFLFGSKSKFTDLCLALVTKTKEEHPQIKRIYVRAEYPHIGEDYENYLLERFDQTYYPKGLLGAGKAIYVKRNYEMIDHSRFCLIYYDETSEAVNRKSGTKIAFHYALKKKKIIFRLP
ncbi:MAG: hypothetical protein IKD18_05770 [Clostridia bacterium]|nr:hypothetical protein [Clostridia bacterium]